MGRRKNVLISFSVSFFAFIKLSAAPKSKDKEQIESIRTVILEPKHSDEMHGCYLELLEKKPSAEGKLVFGWTIDQNGLVSNPHMISGSEEMALASECMLKSIKNWRFPNLKNQVPIDVSYPFHFPKKK